MLPLRLKLQNFVSYRDAEVDFTPVGIAALVGENGAGKSTLLDAMLYALFGQSTKGGPRELDQHVARGESDCRVEFEFALNGGRYLAVRSRSIARNKSTLELFVDEAGTWRPISGKTIADTQRIIEDVLRMDYRTFTAASMILQGQADEFTANMTDAERKEVLARILGLDLWDRLQERVRERLKALSAEEAALVREEAMLQEQAGKRTALETEREAATRELAETEATIRSLEEEISEAERLLGQEAALRQRQRDLEAATQRARRDRDQAERDLRAAEEATRASQAILGRRAEILAAVEDEKRLAADVAEMDRQAQDHVRLSNQVEDLGRKVADHDRQAEGQAARLRAQLEDRRRQAALLSGVPCAGSDLATACPLLSNAREAAKQVRDLEAKLQALEAWRNPYLHPYHQALRARTELGYDADDHAAARALLEEARRTARLLPELQVAEARVEEMRQRAESARGRIDQARTEEAELAAQAQALATELAALVPIREKLFNCRNTLSQARARDAELRQQLGRIDQALSACQQAEASLRELAGKRQAVAEQLAVYRLLDQATGKRGGVPALIMENAVPQIEALANELLARMADGRLAVRLDTQAEGKTTGTMQETLRVTVLDGGVDRPYGTFSGAERFLVDLALRIAISKFLAHRAGAEIQFLALDEGLGCCDAANRQAVMDAIRTAAREFGRVLVVTHLDELKDALPQRIEVVRGPGGSRARVVA